MIMPPLLVQLEWEWDVNVKRSLMKIVMRMRYGMEWRQLGVRESELSVSCQLAMITV